MRSRHRQAKGTQTVPGIPDKQGPLERGRDEWDCSDSRYATEQSGTREKMGEIERQSGEGGGRQSGQEDLSTREEKRRDG